VHQATGPASCGWGFGRPSRRRCSSVLGCTEGAVTRHVEVFGFAGHSCFSASLSIFRGVEDTDRRPNTSLPRYDYAADPVAHPRVTVRMLRSTVSLKSRGVRPAGVTSVGPSASASRRPKEHHRLVRPAKPFSGTHIGLLRRFLLTAAEALGARHLADAMCGSRHSLSGAMGPVPRAPAHGRDREGSRGCPRLTTQHGLGSPACVPCRSLASAVPKSWRSSTFPSPRPALASSSTTSRRRGSTTPTPTTAWRENHFSTTTEFRHYGLGPVCCPVRGLTVSRRCVLFESPDVEGRAAEHCPQPR
jgi:hypothetical protein